MEGDQKDGGEYEDVSKVIESQGRGENFKNDVLEGVLKIEA